MRGHDEYFELFYFAKLCHVIRFFLELNQNVGKIKITFPLLSSSRAIGWQKTYSHELESCLDRIYKTTYHDFTIYKIYFKADSIFTICNEIIGTCAQLFVENKCI